jgi:phosphonopyruvate decarboxylase
MNGMIDPAFFCQALAQRGVDFFTGVPDSLLKSFCAWTAFHAGRDRHITAVNEGAAVAIASGYHLATGKIPLVYMQNSGIGNAVNPLLSLSDPAVYRIPLLLLAGWRGEPGVHDEPQHVKQGRVTPALFEAMEIPQAIMAVNEAELSRQLDDCFASMEKTGGPCALIARKDTFAPWKGGPPPAGETEPALSREGAIEIILAASSPAEIFISTTGMASRELYELREKREEPHERDFLTVGSMGHAASLALAVALQKPDRGVTCLDGDGAALMHLGAFAAIGERKPRNLRHILLNNGAHDSVGGQPTIAPAIDFPAIARASGYTRVFSASSGEEIHTALAGNGAECNAEREGPVFIEIPVRKGARADLGRPTTSPEENKQAFMAALNK